jgi:hypothetical protein
MPHKHQKSMKLPVKPVKAHTTTPGVINPVFRKEFLVDMPGKAGSKVRGVDLALINDALRAISDGNATINGKAPHTREERFIVIASYFKTVKTRLNMSFNGAVNVKNNCTVAIKHNDQSFICKFPEPLNEVCL